eukprot:2567807-Pyramimonas_sp.AAC.1
MDSIRWQFQCLYDGVRPNVRYDGSEWAQGTNISDLSFRGCLLYIKGDWIEHTRGLGLSSYGQYHHSCQYCKNVKPELGEDEGMDTLDSFAFQLRTCNEYDAACRK